MQKNLVWPGTLLRKTRESPGEDAPNFPDTDTLGMINNSISWSLCNVLEISLLTKEGG